HPFGTKNAPDLMRKHVEEAPEPLLQRVPDAGIPAALDDVVLRCLEKSPDDRYESMAAVDVALATAVGLETSSPQRIAPSPTRSNPAAPASPPGAPGLVPTAVDRPSPSKSSKPSPASPSPSKQSKPSPAAPSPSKASKPSLAAPSEVPLHDQPTST